MQGTAGMPGQGKMGTLEPLRVGNEGSLNLPDKAKWTPAFFQGEERMFSRSAAAGQSGSSTSSGTGDRFT